MFVVSLFYSNRPMALLLIPIIVSVFSGLNFITNTFHFDAELNLGFWGRWKFNFYWLSAIIANVIIVLNAIILNQVYNRNEFLDRNSYIPSVLYVLTASAFNSFYFLSGFVIAQLFLVLSIRQLLRLNQNEDGRKAVFNASFLLSVAITVYPSLFILVPFIFWIIWVFRPFVLRESMLAIVAILIPLFYSRMFQAIFDIEVNKESFSTISYDYNGAAIVSLAIVMTAMFVMSIKTLLKKIQQSSIRMRKILNVILVLFISFDLIAAFEGFLYQKPDGLLLIALTSSLILSYSFGYKKLRDSGTIIFYVLLLISLGKFFYKLPF